MGDEQVALVVVHKLRLRAGVQATLGLNARQLSQGGGHRRIAADDEDVIALPLLPDMDVPAAQPAQHGAGLVAGEGAIGVGGQPVEHGMAGHLGRGIGANAVDQAAERGLGGIRP